MPTLLDYSMMTEPFPLQASPGTGTVRPSKLTIVASNPNPEVPVTINKISITFPIGSKASDLTNVVPPNPIPPQNWLYSGKSEGTGVVVYRFNPKAGQKEVTDQGLNFVFNDVVVNTQPGTFRIEIEEVSPDAENVAVLQVAKFPYGWGEVYFGVDPANIQIGEETTLDWVGPAGAEYKIEYSVPGKVIWIPKQGQDPLGNKGTYPGQGDPPLKPQVTTTFTLHVWMSNRRYHAQQQRTVTVYSLPPSIEYFRPRGCSTSECVINDDEFALEWKILNAEPNECQLTQEWPEFPEKPVTVIPMPWTSNFVLVRPTEKLTRYTLMVKDKFTELTATVNATLAPPVPVGTIVPYGAKFANELPSGWLYCNGSEYVKDRYPQLYPAIKDIYGTSRSTANGVLPDLRGYFVRGYDDGRGIDPGRGMGTFQQDTFKSHTHTQVVTANQNSGGTAVRASFTGDVGGYSVYEQKADTKPTGDAETRAKNMACYFVMYAGVYKPPVRSKAKPNDKKNKKDKSKGKKAAARGGGRAGGRSSGG